MFTLQDIELLEQAGSWEKIRDIQSNIFPKLVALQTEANKLIYHIYRIDVNRDYKFSQTPSLPSRKKQIYNQKRRGNDESVLFGLRAKGKPSHLTRPDGKVCEMHFALLAFSIDKYEGEYLLGIDFAPYILNYSNFHRIQFNHLLLKYDLYDLMSDNLELGSYWISHQCSLKELFQKDKARVSLNLKKLLEITMEDLADLVITYTTCFPFLDLWTKMSNGELEENNLQKKRFNYQYPITMLY
jgi:hypothetical protein